MYTALKLALTLPVSSVEAERAFSKLALILTKLRTTSGQVRSEDLMIISCEQDIPIDYDKVIEIFAGFSSLLTKALLF